MCHDDALVLGWIVTLDVLKCCMSGYKFYKLNRLNSNIRCIEIWM